MITSGADFVLEEDGDSSHGPRNNGNIVRKWKEQQGLEFYFNCVQSPDLAPIENCWQPTKQHTRQHAHWDEETLKELVIEGWKQIEQRWINRRINSMVKRLKEVRDRNGELSTIEACDTDEED